MNTNPGSRARAWVASDNPFEVGELAYQLIAFQWHAYWRGERRTAPVATMPYLSSETEREAAHRAYDAAVDEGHRLFRSSRLHWW